MFEYRAETKLRAEDHEQFLTDAHWLLPVKVACL